MLRELSLPHHPLPPTFLSCSGIEVRNAGRHLSLKEVGRLWGRGEVAFEALRQMLPISLENSGRKVNYSMEGAGEIVQG